MNTVMKTTVLACLLVAALQFSQAIPLAAPAKTTNTLAVRADPSECVKEIVETLYSDVPGWVLICLKVAQDNPSLSFFIEFPICASLVGGADFVRVALDVAKRCH